MKVPSGESGGRSARIDALKFAAVALVVLSHVANLPQYADALGQAVYVIRAVNMPLFMFLGGYVLFGREGTGPLRFLERKAMALMVPYFAWLLVGLFIEHVPLEQFLPQLWAGLINPEAEGRKWFLYVLFLFYVLFVLVRAGSRRDGWLIAAALATVAFTYLPGEELFGRYNVQWLFTFFVGGYLAAKHRERLPRASRSLVLSSLVAFVALLLVGALPDAGEGWPPLFYRWVDALFVGAWAEKSIFLLWKYSTAFAGITLLVGLYALAEPRLLSQQAFAGRRSLGIYVIQGWLMPFAIGNGAAGIIATAVLIVGASLALTLLLEQWAPTRIILLGGARKRKAPADDVPKTESLAA